ncbi:hypothetical protein IFM89_031059 [Coptis chinensis]|uniref:SAM domain-containing protein n=1 Tax=Coptis chinensis TaxID=261450 RepID=A0A835LJ79_9MAGN|nr:hypothetical protein IFM89_031059 [Coptis chinensis]
MMRTSISTTLLVRACPLSIPMPDKLDVFGGDARKAHLGPNSTEWVGMQFVVLEVVYLFGINLSFLYLIPINKNGWRLSMIPGIFDSGPPFATFLFERDSPYVIATSKEEFCVVWYEHLTPEKGDGYKDRLPVDCLEFQVKRSTDGENGLLVNPVCKGQSAFTIEGCYFYQIANMQWKNGDKGRLDFSTDSSQTPVVGPVDLLNNLSCMMQDLNYYSYWRHDDQWSFDVPAAGIVRLEVPNLKLEELSLERFLDFLGLGDYLQTFQGKKVDMEALKNTDMNKLKDLKIPLVVLSKRAGGKLDCSSTCDILFFFFVKMSLEKDRTLNWYALNPNTGNCNIIPQISSKENTALPVDYGSAIFNSKIYIVGGRLAPHKSSPINDVQVFDPITKELHTVDSLSWRLGLFLPVLPIEGFGIYVFGGWVPTLGRSSTMVRSGTNYLPEPPSEITRIEPYPASLLNEETSSFFGVKFYVVYIISLNQAGISLSYPFRMILILCPGRFLSYTKNVAVVDDKLYWCFGNLFAFPLNRINNGYIDNTVYKFEQSDSLTTAPSVFSCKECLLPHSMVPIGKEQLCVVWFNLVDIENGITVSWNNFQIRKQSRSRESKDVHVFSIGGLHTTKVDGFCIF